MRELKNPYQNTPNHNCFGCAKNNPLGLKMNFFEEDDYIQSKWLPQKDFQGFENVLHGGIQTTLMDEIASWVVFVKLKTAGFTTQMNIKLIKSVLISKGEITIKAKLQEQKRNLAFIHVEIYDSENILCSQGEFVYFTFSQDQAKQKFNYPGSENF